MAVCWDSVTRKAEGPPAPELLSRYCEELDVEGPREPEGPPERKGLGPTGSRFSPGGLGLTSDRGDQTGPFEGPKSAELVLGALAADSGSLSPDTRQAGSGGPSLSIEEVVGDLKGSCGSGVGLPSSERSRLVELADLGSSEKGVALGSDPEASSEPRRPGGPEGVHTVDGHVPEAGWGLNGGVRAATTPVGGCKAAPSTAVGGCEAASSTAVGGSGAPSTPVGRSRAESPLSGARSSMNDGLS